LLDLCALAAFFALEAVLLLGSLWAFRLAGYRVVFRKTQAAVTESAIDAEEGGQKQ
jgi:hypothetical protein